MKSLLLIVMVILTEVGFSQNVIISDDSTYAGTTDNAILEVHSANGNKGILVPRMTTAQRTAITTSSIDEGLLVYDTDTHSFWVWDGTSWIEISDKQNLTLSGNTLSIENGNSVDLSSFMDNTDNQTLSLSGTTLSISGGNNVDISGAITTNAWSLTGNSGTSSSTNFLGTTDANDLVLKANDNEQARVLSGTEHGIGIPNGLYAIWGRNSSNNGWIRALLPAYTDDDIYIGSGANPTSTNIHFDVGGYNSTSAMFIDGTNGHVGIGTATPASDARLTVTQGNVKDIDACVVAERSSGESQIMLSHDGALELFRDPNSSNLVSPNISGYIDFRDNLSDDFDLRLAFNDTVSSDGAFVVYTTTTGGPSGSVPSLTVLNANSYVGIGTISPHAKLEIKNPNNTEFLRLNRAGAEPFKVLFGDNQGNESNSDGVVYFEINGDESYVFGGHVMPDADGTRYLGKSGHRWMEVWAANGTIQTSDMNDKTSVKSLQYGLDEILKLHPITFRWKQDELNHNDFKIGLSAQELQKILPEVVVKDKNNPNASLGVMYSDIIPVLVKAIQEQQKKFEETIKAQQKEIDELKKMIEHLKSE